MPEPPVLSVIIPTYNRCDSLLRTLASLNAQTYPLPAFEVLVIDDGGDDETEGVVQQPFAFRLRYVRQNNSGAAAARNQGARLSQGEFLLLLDDDITLDEECLQRLVAALAARPRVIVAGNLVTLPPLSAEPSPFHALLPRIFKSASDNASTPEISFLDCLSGLLALRCADYFHLGMMQPLHSGGGADAWCDVDFGYRAFRHGFTFYRCHEAIGYHHDYTVSSIGAFCRHQEKIGRTGAHFLRKYPDLRGHIPMLADKDPIAWKLDPPRLVLDKLFHQVASHKWIVAAMLRLIALLEQTRALPALLVLFYRWVVSAHIFRGYREVFWR